MELGSELNSEAIDGSANRTFDELCDAALDFACNRSLTDFTESEDAWFKSAHRLYMRGMARLFPILLVVVQRADFPAFSHYANYEGSNIFDKDSYVAVPEDNFWYSFVGYPEGAEDERKRLDYYMKEISSFDYQKLMEEIPQCGGWASAVELTKRQFRFVENYRYMILHEANRYRNSLRITRNKVFRDSGEKIQFEFLDEVYEGPYFCLRGMEGKQRVRPVEYPSLF